MAASLALAAALAIPARAEVREDRGHAPNPPWARELAALRAQVARLSARVAKLEEGRVAAADLVGTYSLWDIATYLTAGPPAQVTTQTTTGTVTLAANGTGSVSLRDLGVNLFEGSPWSVTPVDRNEATTFTWTYDAGSLRITTPGGEEVVYQVPAGGRVLAGVSRDTFASELIILTRLQ